MGAKSIDNIINAFYKGKKLRNNHDYAENYELFYRNNKIAWIDNGELFINSCEWMTNTTKSRLNQLGKFYIKQKDYQWFIDDKLWDGTEINITKLLKEENDNR